MEFGLQAPKRIPSSNPHHPHLSHLPDLGGWCRAVKFPCCFSWNALSSDESWLHKPHTQEWSSVEQWRYMGRGDGWMFGSTWVFGFIYLTQTVCSERGEFRLGWGGGKNSFSLLHTQYKPGNRKGGQVINRLLVISEDFRNYRAICPPEECVETKWI